MPAFLHQNQRRRQQKRRGTAWLWRGNNEGGADVMDSAGGSQHAPKMALRTRKATHTIAVQERSLPSLMPHRYQVCRKELSEPLPMQRSWLCVGLAWSDFREAISCTRFACHGPPSKAPLAQTKRNSSPRWPMATCKFRLKGPIVLEVYTSSESE